MDKQFYLEEIKRFKRVAVTLQSEGMPMDQIMDTLLNYIKLKSKKAICGKKNEGNAQQQKL